MQTLAISRLDHYNAMSSGYDCEAVADDSECGGVFGDFDQSKRTPVTPLVVKLRRVPAPARIEI